MFHNTIVELVREVRIVVTVSFSLTLLCSCTQGVTDNPEARMRHVESGNILSIGTHLDSIGIMHNIACDSVWDNVSWDTTATMLSNLFLIRQVGLGALATTIHFDTADIGIESVLFLESHAEPWLVGDRPFHALSWVVNEYSSEPVWDPISTMDKMYIDSLSEWCLNYNLAGQMWSKVFDDATDKSSALISSINDTSFSGSCGGELATAVCRIANSSASLWKAKVSTLPMGDNRRDSALALTILQVDAAAALAMEIYLLA